VPLGAADSFDETAADAADDDDAVLVGGSAASEDDADDDEGPEEVVSEFRLPVPHAASTIASPIPTTASARGSRNRLAGIRPQRCLCEKMTPPGNRMPRAPSQPFGQG